MTEREEDPMDNRGVLCVVSGFSGAGKGTLMRRLLSEYDNYALSVSATTRKPREGEADGREYFFKTTEEFERMIRDGELLEYARYVDHYYGTPRSYVMKNLEAGKDVLLEIEIQGAMNIRKAFPEALLIFVTPPSAEELKNRLIGRGTEDMETIAARLSRASEEAAGMDQYDYLVVNDQVERCAEEMHGIIQAAHARMNNHLAFVKKIQEQMKQYRKA
jgi:guanylate kinase